MCTDRVPSRRTKLGMLKLSVWWHLFQIQAMQLTIRRLSGENPVTVAVEPDAQVEELFEYISAPPFTDLKFYFGSTELRKGARLGDMGVQNRGLVTVAKSPDLDTAIAALPPRYQPAQDFLRAALGNDRVLNDAGAQLLDESQVHALLTVTKSPDPASALDFLMKHVKVCELEPHQTAALLRVRMQKYRQQAVTILGYGVNLQTCAPHVVESLTEQDAFVEVSFVLEALLSKHSEDTLCTHMCDCGGKVSRNLYMAASTQLPCLRRVSRNLCKRASLQGYSHIALKHTTSVLARFAAIVCDGAQLRVAKDIMTQLSDRPYLRDEWRGFFREAQVAMERAVAKLRRVDSDGREWTFAQIAAQHAETRAEQEIRDYWGKMQKLPQEQSTGPVVAAVPTEVCAAQTVQEPAASSQETTPEAAAELERNDFHAALEESRADVRNADKVRVMRLTDYGKNVMQRLAASRHLSGDIDAIAAAGCEALPAWGNGALLLVPLTRDIAAEADDWSPQPYHIVLRDAQRASLFKALRAIPREEVRPKLREEKTPGGPEHRRGQEQAPTPSAASSSSPTLQESMLSHDAVELEPEMRQRLRRLGLTLEHTFLRQRSQEESESHFVARTL